MTTTISTLPPGITQNFNRHLLKSMMHLINDYINKNKEKLNKTYRFGSNRHKKLQSYIDFIKGFYEWEETKEESEKKAIAARLLSISNDFRGRARKIHEGFLWICREVPFNRRNDEVYKVQRSERDWIEWLNEG
jgi:hypothetical protein